MQKVTEISLLHNQSVSSSNGYVPYCNRKMINIDLNEFWHSLPAKNKNSEIQIEYFTEKCGNTKYHAAWPPIPHTPYPRTKFTQAKKWQLMHVMICKRSYG